MPTSPDEPTDPATSRPTPPSAPPDAYPFYIGDLKRAMRQHHADLGAQVQSTLDDLTTRWQPVQATLANTIQRLRRQMEAAQAQGDHVTYAWLAQAERLAELKAAVAGNVGKFAEGARQIIGEGQEGAITLGSQVAQEALAATVPAGMNMVFGVPPDDVTDALAGALQPGTPLSDLFSGFGSTAAQFAEQALFTSVALGEGPAQAAQRLTWATNMSAQRAEVIARTELARSWRSAQMANYRANSDVVAQWQWSADFGPRCCGACMAMDGTIHELSEELDDHICGRCSALPITRSWADILGDAGIDASNVSGLGGAGGMASLEETSLAAQRGGVNGREWFAKQSAEMQNAILGPAKAEAYRAGDLTLEQLVDYHYSPEWGWSLREASLADLGLDARAYLGAARGNGTADLASLREQRAATERIVREIGAAERARAQEIKAAADEWYAGVERAIGRSASGSPEQLAEAKAAADEWYAQIEQSIARGQVAPGAYDRSWDIRREEAIAVAEGRASFLPQSVAGEAAADARADLTPEATDTDKAFSPLAAPGGRGEVATYDLTAADRAFVQALKQQIPDGGITTYQEAIALGQQLSERINGQLTDLQAYADEEALIRQVAPDLTDAQRAWAMGDKAADAAHGGVHWTHAAEQLQSAYQGQVRAYLAEIRPLGGVEVNLTDDADALIAERLSSATEMMPSDWLQASNDLGEINLVKSGARSYAGWFQESYNGTGTIALRYVKASDAADLESTVLHEMTHRMEQAVPTLSDMQAQFYEARTVGEEFVQLSNGVKMETKLDEWLNEYLGREPLAIAHPGILQPDGTYRYAAKSYELLTMGSEMALAPGASASTFALHADSEYEAFVLGSLMGVRAPLDAAASAAAEGVDSSLAGLARGEAAYAARQTVGTALSADERAAVQEAVARGELPKSYAKYTSVEQLTKTAKGSAWYSERATASEAAVTAEAASSADLATTATRALTDGERAAIQDAVSTGDLPKSYARYTRVEQLAKTAKGRSWLAAQTAVETPEQIAPRDLDVFAAPGVLGAPDASEANELVSPPDLEEDRVIEKMARRLAGDADFADLAASHGMTPDDMAAKLVYEWSASSNEASMVALKLAAADEFGLVGIAPEYADGAEAISGNFAPHADYAAHAAGYRAFARAQYEATQEYLADHNVTSLTLYRGSAYQQPPSKAGIEWPGSGEASMQTRALTNFSTEPDIADQFLGGFGDYNYSLTISADVPANRIFSLPATGAGADYQWEVLVLGGTDRYTYVARIEDSADASANS